MTQFLKTLQRQNLAQKLSPVLIQTQRLLSMSNIELEEEIRKQLQENPVLEQVQPESPPETVKVSSLQSVSSKKATDNDVLSEFLINKSAYIKESPFDQLRLAELNEKEMLIGEEIIGSLDSDGYLRISDKDIINSISSKYGFSPEAEDIERIRVKIMHFEPAGIASRNLQECLIVQLEEADTDDADKNMAMGLLKNYFDDFTHKRYEKISSDMGITAEYLSKLLEIIHRLSPVPSFSDTKADYIIPDFIVSENNGVLKAELNNEYQSDIKINPAYQKILESDTTDADSKSFIKNKIESARNFINLIKNRRKTLLKIMNCILEKQNEFFMNRGGTLKPMLEKDLASELGLDISAISRAVKRKYVQTSFGIFELRSFFAQPVQVIAGEGVSGAAIKQKIMEIINSEDKSKPLTDEKIAEMINKSGFSVARRTIVKYREAMKIPKATLRRKIML